ncbi:MAG: hypothetical protein M3418_06875 [Gemmatimonadota bacterium]|nr:hypothetical protein [Gemmatimonadota bacterium]
MDPQNCLRWSAEDAQRNANAFDVEKSLHTKLHVNLHAQPFVGNLEKSFVYILFGNPGFAVQDYQDELSNPLHAAACAANLRKSEQAFSLFPPGSIGTGVANVSVQWVCAAG